MRAVAGRPNRVRFRFEDEAGTLTAASSVTATVLAGDGSTIMVDEAAEADEVTGVYYVTLDPQDQLDVLTAIATGTIAGAVQTVTEQVHLVDRRLAPLSVYKQDDRLGALPLLDFLRAVDKAEDAITDELNTSPVIVGARPEWRVGHAQIRLRVPEIYDPKLPYELHRDADNVLTNDVHVRDNALEIGFGSVYGVTPYDPILGSTGMPWLPGVYKAWLAHGWDSTPADLQHAAVMLARHYALSGATSYPARVTRIMTEASEIWFAKPGSDNPFGIPEVDAAVVRHRVPVVFGSDPGAF